MPGTLVLCSTPIGNLGDVSHRLVETLSAADVIYAEDTRRTNTLLARIGVDTPARSYFVGNERARSVELAHRLGRGETVAFVTDAGTPAVSDPGVSAIRAAVEVGAEITVVPGPSAVTAALAVSGFDADRFVFEGFLPRRGRRRRERLERIAEETRTVVLFAAPHRIAADLADLADLAGERELVVARELTKRHEEVWRGTVAEAARHWGAEVEPRGEFTLVLAGAERRRGDLGVALDLVFDEIAEGARLSDAVRDVAEEVGVSRRLLYEAALERRSAERGGT
ncbi:MAG TPA: 16S rRNA (cytidine(1402)-2'-O)-methyltransferase [Actinobacteria bacterium]|nr:16S rRNA (cytidine(1402)-2'-O)-methyltransferase [Actinomycetota bacterium]